MVNFLSSSEKKNLHIKYVHMPTIAFNLDLSRFWKKKSGCDTFLKGIAYEIQNMNCKCAATILYVCT